MKRITALLLTAALCLSLCGITASAVNIELGIGTKETYYGTCGDNLTWTFDTETGVLDITGTGDMSDYGWSGSSVYGHLSNISIINIADGVTSIGDRAFYYCDSLTSITIPDSVTSIGDYAFYKCTSLTSITIPDSVTSIGSYAFSDCKSLTSITIPDSVTSIGNNAFSGCSALTSITIGGSVTSIGDEAFYGCTSLTSITIPDSVTSIGSYAFRDCSSLTSITIPDSVTSIGDEAFLDCSSLVSFNVDNANENYASVDGVLFNKGKTEIICYPSEKNNSSYTIPDSVTSIGSSAFSDCTSLEGITIHDSVTSIGGSAFSDCTSLEGITIPDSVTEIGYFAFSGCSSLTSITIPDSITSIVEYVFFACDSLTSITIPDSVTSIVVSAFYDCNSLETVYYTGSEDEWNAISIGAYNDYLASAQIIFNYVPGMEVEPEEPEDTSSESESEEESSEPESEEESGIVIDESANIDDFTAGGNVAAGGVEVTVDGEPFASGDKLTDGAYRGDGVHGWDDGGVTAQFIGAGKRVEYKFSFENATDLVTVLFRNVLVTEGSGLGSLYIKADAGESITPLSFDNGVEITNLRYIPVAGMPNYYNVVAEIAVNGATEVTLTLVTAEDSCEFDEIELYVPEADVLYGDANGDGTINSLDAAQILKHDATLIVLEGGALTAADVNGDGAVNSLDAAMILRFDAGLITEF